VKPVPPDTPFAKKSFGQNFLVDPQYIDRIAQALSMEVGDTVVEIGPGRGALTERLLDRAGRVIGIELDRDMSSILKAKFADRANFELLETDVLKVDLASLALASGVQAKVKVAANLPYNISTAVLQNLIEQREVLSELVLMFQREVAERISALPGESTRGYLTVLVESCFVVERLFDVPPRSFRPAPKVWSSVVRLRPRLDRVNDYESLRKLVGCAFAQKRKTLLNNLKKCLNEAEAVLDAASIDSSRRAESLNAEEWQSLAAAMTDVS
jgi:16S rRNA (adenine1518-N6/adenine1519-N6)-dimethyltransferase